VNRQQNRSKTVAFIAFVKKKQTFSLAATLKIITFAARRMTLVTNEQEF